MSKNLPLWQPGGEWQPPIFRVRGTMPGSVEEQLLLQSYAGRLKQFYLGARRQHLGGIVGQSSFSRRFDDATMHYTNIMGQEIVEIDLQLEADNIPVVRSSRPWDWLLLDYRVPLTGSAAHAHLRAARVGRTAAEEIAYDSTAPDPPTTDGLVEPIIQYPPGLSAIVRDNPIEFEVQTSSLAIDLRRFGAPGQVVEVDIEGYLSVDSETQQQLDFYAAGGFDDTIISDVSHNGDYDINTTNYSDWSATIFPGDVFPYVAGGTQTSPGISLSGFESVLAEDAPKAPRAIVSSPTDTMNPTTSHADAAVGFLDAFTHSINHYVNLVYHTASGLLESGTIHSCSVHYTSASGSIGPDGKLHEYGNYYIRVTEVYYERTIFPGYEDVSVPIPATVQGAMYFAAGYGTPPWEEGFITDAETNHYRWGVLEGDAFKFLGTAQLSEDVTISDSIDEVEAGEGPYKPVGRLIVNPRAQTVSFKVA